MLEHLFLSVPGTKPSITAEATYESLQRPLTFPEDIYGVANWVMKFPLVLYSANLTESHTFNHGSVKVERVNGVSLELKWKFFIITKNNGKRLYCTSQIFFVTMH